MLDLCVCVCVFFLCEKKLCVCLLVVLTCSAIAFTQRNDFFGTISSSSFHREKEIAEAPSSIPNLPLVEELKLEEEDNHQEEEQNFEFDEKEVITSQKRVKKVCVTIHLCAT